MTYTGDCKTEKKVPVLKSSAGCRAVYNDREYACFAGNNYLGLAGHPEVCKGARNAVNDRGVSVAASRETTGTADIHIILESALAEFKGSEAACVFASGYMGNRILISALREEIQTFLIDSHAHPSIKDGIPREARVVEVYNHRDTAHLEHLLARTPKPALIMTDGLFPLTGELAPLDSIAALAEMYNALILVDDAHATGVLGPQGRGTPDFFKVYGHPSIYQTETMSKAIGVFGGFIAADLSFVNNIRVRSSAYIGSTALPPPLAGAGIAALKIIKNEPERRQKLYANIRKTMKGMTDLGFEVPQEEVPIIPVYFEDSGSAEALSMFFMENGILAPSVTYPVKLSRSLVRVTLSSDHTEDQIEHLLFMLKKWRDSHLS